MKVFLLLGAICVLATPLLHPFGAVRRQRTAMTLPGDAAVSPLIERSCQNCHSEKTVWPAYSYLPLVSWAVEKDVAEARRHLNFSRWEDYSLDQKRDLLARIGAEVRNREMPLPRYLMLHPEARLSEEDRQTIYEWTKSERRRMKAGIKTGPRESIAMSQ